MTPTTPTDGPRGKAPSLQPRLWLAAAVALAFAFPNLAALWYRADPLTIANESVGYRYLFSERLLNGEGASVWVLAGFLTTAIQTTGLAVINLFSHPTPDELHWRLLVFSYGFSALVVLAAVTVLFAAARNRRLSFAELALLALPALGPAFATRSSGFYYYTLPDYYHLNVLLTLVSVWLFLLMWQEEQPVARPLRRLGLLGLYVGMMGSNKITMLPLGLALLAPAVFASPLNWPRFLARGFVAAAGIALGFVFVGWWFYLFKLGEIRAMFSTWLGLVSNPGGESNFWSSNFRGNLTGYSYGYILAFFLATLVLAVGVALRDAALRRRILVVAGVSLLGMIVWCYFIYKRPAGTTYFEAAVALFGFATINLIAIARRPWAGRLIAGVLLFWLGYSAATFKRQENLATLRESAPWGRNMWQLHRELLEFAHDREIIVIHPENNYCYGGVAEFLLKGTAEVTSWNVTSNGRPVLERYAPHMSFRHEKGGPHPNAPYPGNVVLFWVDRPELPPLTERYSLLKASALLVGTEHKNWSMLIQSGQATIQAHALSLPPENIAKKQKAVAAPPEEFAGTWIKPDTISLRWRPDLVAQVAFQLKSGNGDWFALGRASPTMDAYQVGDVNPAITYTIRARKEFADGRSAWVEIVVPPVNSTPAGSPK